MVRVLNDLFTVHSMHLMDATVRCPMSSSFEAKDPITFAEPRCLNGKVGISLVSFSTISIDISIGLY